MDALVLGASGLIGGELIQLLLKDNAIKKVKIIVRNHLPIVHDKLEQIYADYTTIEGQKEKLKSDVVYCCIGTTKQKTPNLNQYYQIDHDYPVLLGKLCLEHGAKCFNLVSSLGANTYSSVFYTKTKGETERDILALDFESIHIYRPSLLTGKRLEKRGLERILYWIMKFVNPILFGSLKKYQSISATTVAIAMHKQSKLNNKGQFIYQSDKIKKIA